MIRSVSDVTALLDRRFGSAISRPWSLVRTLVWVVVGIFLVGLILPAPKVKLNSTYYNKTALRHSPVKDLMLDKNDPRGWKHLKKDPKKFTIAWVGGSSIQTVRPRHHGFVPVDVQRQLPKIDGKPVQVNMYLMEASRIYDLFAATAEALKSKPDMVILDLNPIWMFNPNAIQSWPSLNSTVLPSLVTDVANWPLLAGLNSPTDVALTAGGHLPAIRDRWSYAKKLRSLVHTLAPNPKAVDPHASATRLHGTQLIATMQASLNFWNYYRLIPADTPNAQRYTALMAKSKTDGSVINDSIIARTFSTMIDSKIPSIAYTSAVDPRSLAQPGVDATLGRIEAHLKTIANQHHSRTLLVQPNSAIRSVRGLKFRDMVHTTYDPPLVDYLTAMICSHLTANDPATKCTPTPRTATR